MNDIEDIYPLSPTQEGMLFHSTTSPEHGLYVELTTFRVRGELDLTELGAAWQRAIARHPVLRTAFVRERIRTPHQVVLPKADLPIEFRDLSGLDGPARERAVAEELEQRARERFDLARPPLMRLLVLRLPDEHLVVWTYHHLLLDGWSAALLLAEVTAGLSGDAAEPPAPPAFREYIAWLGRQEAERDRAFWTGYLAGYREPATLSLPGVRPGAKPSGDFRTVRAELPAETVTALRRLAAGRATTLSSLVEAAWAGTVARHSGRDDVVVGVTVSGRPVDLHRADQMLGMFINTVPVRVRIDRELPGDEWLARHAATRHPLLDHQHTPLTDIQRWADTAPGVPLFDTVVVVENYPDRTEAVLSHGAVTVSDVRYETRTNYPVTLVVRAAAEMQLQAVVDAGRITPEETGALLDHVVAVLTRIAAQPGRPVRELLAVPEAARARQLDTWNGSEIDRGEPSALLSGLIDDAVRSRPDHPAVVDQQTRYSYRELDRRAKALARQLAARGVRPGDRVGVCLGRSADLVTAMLAVARAGAAFVPLDPAHPVERIGLVLADAAPAVVLTDATGAPALAGWDGTAVDLASLDLADLDLTLQEAADPAAAELPGAAPDGLAYLMFTSGSTGRPKGVAVGHRALANLVDSLARRHPGLDGDTRFLALTTLGFDTSLAELLVPLAVGATVYVGGQALGLSGRELDRYSVEHGITALQATPSRYRALLDSDWQGAGRPRLYSCGEAFPADLAAPLAERGESVWNMYGPTETTVYSSVERITADTTRVTVGRPIANTVLHVLDTVDGELLPVGCVGELCIGGDGVAQGYWQRPELTAERFVTDPFTGGRMYRTGDHARRLPDGRIELLGRMDRQLKLRGYRIEPGEIEQVLLALPEVAAAAVAVREGRLVAWVVPADRGAPLDAPGVQAGLRRSLPSYMVPEAVTVLAELPLTPAGKTDLLALPTPAGFADEAAPSGGPGGTADHEALVARLFREVLALPEVGLDDDFFELGGDSLRALRLVSRLEAELGCSLDIELLFDSSTVRDLTAAIGPALTDADADAPAGSDAPGSDADQ
ncbi:amino acid adenylation domain-containing protein [Kitasatospora sp. NPDC091276]|uniref:non-ribosomal peptide synthetase n=1 Tax=Kitasatospora sp. NPDC091276 TaxID=3155300 RepID=UPI0034179D8B